MKTYEIKMTMYLVIEAENEEKALEKANEEYSDHSLEIIEEEK